MRVRTLASLAAAVLAPLVAPLRAQDAPPPTFRAGIHLVRIHATVTDSDGKPVRGLTAADFMVSEDGDPRPILTFAAVTLPGNAPSSTTVPASDVVTNDLNPDRLVVLVMDDAQAGRINFGRYTADTPALVGVDPRVRGGPALDPAVAIDGKRIGREVVDALGPRDMAAVVFTSFGRFQKFTTDRSKLIAAVESFVPKADSGSSLNCALAGPGKDCFVRTIAAVAEALPVNMGRRHVIIFIGPDKIVPALNADGTAGGDLLPVGHATPAANMYRALHRANVTVYGIDVNGLDIDGHGMDHFRALAEGTGGQLITRDNRPWLRVPDVIEHTSSFYILGLEPTFPDKPFQRIRVSTRRPDLRVQTQSGYFAPTFEPSGERTATPAGQALTSAVPQGGLRLRATAVAIGPSSSTEVDALVVTGIYPEPAAAGATQVFGVSVTAFDDSRRVTSVRQSAGLRRNVWQADQPVEVISRLTLRPGRQEIAIVVEHAGLTGSVFLDLEVPALTKETLVVSAPVLETRDSLAVTRTGDVAGGFGEGATTRRQFDRNEIVGLGMRITRGNQIDMVPVAVTARVVGERDEAVWEERSVLEPSQFNNVGNADYRVSLPLARLGPGNYAMAVDFAIGSEVIQRNLRFTVQ